MTHTWLTRLACTLSVALLTVSSVRSQNTSPTGGQQVVDERSKAQSAEIAEAIIAREEAASGRTFDRAYRDGVKANLALLSPEELAAFEKRGFGLLPQSNVLARTAPDLGSPNALTLGQSTADLVFNPVPPCRIIDTRLAGGPIAGGSTRNFFAAGVNFSSQGGFAGDCGVPLGPTTAVAVNLTAVPTAAGDLRAFPFPGTAPLASVLNYGSQNIANQIELRICDSSVSTCAHDFTVQADGGGTDLVADVMGYFAAPVKTPLTITEVQNSVSVAAGANATLQAACPAQTTLTGGGCGFGTFTSPLVLLATNPLGNSWNCGVRNSGASADTLIVFALCGVTPGR